MWTANEHLSNTGTLCKPKNDLTLESRQCQLSRPPFLRPLSSKVPQLCARRRCPLEHQHRHLTFTLGLSKPFRRAPFSSSAGPERHPPAPVSPVGASPAPAALPGPGRPPGPGASPPSRPATRPRRLPSAAPRPRTPGAGPPATPYGRSTRRFPSERGGGGSRRGCYGLHRILKLRATAAPLPASPSQRPRELPGRRSSTIEGAPGGLES